jgi:signal transduction histidine kinase
MRAPLPENEQQRLAELYSYEILDTPADEDFDDVVHLASTICHTPLSDITLIDAERQWFKARNIAGPSENSRDVSFCAYTILQEDVFVVSDATQDERFFSNPLVNGDPHIRFYAGVPLVSPNGYSLGALCVLDKKPGTLDEDQRIALRFLGKQVMKLLELHRQNRELRRYILNEQVLRKELERITEAQKMMISVIAHDVRGPIHSLKTVLNLFQDDGLEISDVQSLIPLASRDMDGTLELLDNIVDWGVLEMQQGPPESEAFPVYPLVERLRPLFEQRLRDKDNILVNEIPKKLGIHADPNVLQFILRNLVDNAGKFTTGGEVTVGGAIVPGVPTDIVRIFVRDTGKGMPAHVADQLFKPGFRYTSKGTKDEKGSGLGLRLCAQFMDRLGGRIFANSVEGRGSTITLEIPR